MRSIAPIKNKAQAIRHLGDHDSMEDIVAHLTDLVSFRTWLPHGLRSRSRSDYYVGYRFQDPGQLPAPYDELFVSHAQDNEYTVFIQDTPVAWFNTRLGWVAPKFAGFTETQFAVDYEKAYNAILTLTGKGSTQ